MADASLLALLAGTDPQAAQMLAGAQGLQLSQAATDPNFGHNEGLFGALAKTLAGIRGGNMTNQAVQANMAARQAAAPELAKLYGSDDPYKMIGENPGGYSQSTLATILASANPDKIAQMRLLNAQTGVATMKAQPGPEQPSVAAARGAAPAASRGAPQSGGLTSIASLTSGRPQPAAEDVDPAAILSLPAPQQAQAVARLTPQQRAILAAKIAKQRQGAAVGRP